MPLLDSDVIETGDLAVDEEPRVEWNGVRVVFSAFTWRPLLGPNLGRT
jgi:hypothetical protein